MSVAPDLLTLGIELELVVQGDQETIRQQMATFLSSSLNVAVVAPPDPRYRDAKAWILKTDGSIRWEDHKIQPPPRAAIEIVSPVFTDRASQRQTREKWQRDLKEVFETVKSNYTIGVNKSTAYHIHVGVGVSGVRLEHRFNLVEMKKIATAYVRLEAIDKLHAPHRADKVTNPAYYVNTVVGNRTLKGMLAEQVVELIWSTQTTEALVKILNPEAELGNIDSRRYYRVNFCSNNVHGTIEFRQHEGTDDLQAIYAWAELVLAFVRSALGKSEETMKRWGRHPEALQDFIGPDVHGKMVSLPSTNHPHIPRVRSLPSELRKMDHDRPPTTDAKVPMGYDLLRASCLLAERCIEYLKPRYWVFRALAAWVIHVCTRIKRIVPRGHRKAASEPCREDHSSIGNSTPALDQRWNLDTLGHIISYLPTTDLPKAAAVSWDWALAARAPLYAHIQFDTDLDSTSFLIRTIRGCPHLLPLIRSISMNIGINRADVEWLQLLPEDTIHTFEVNQWGTEDDVATFILSTPSIRHVRHLACRNRFIQNCEQLKTCFALPKLESLRLWTSFPVDEIQSISIPPNLTCLHLTLYNYSPFVLRVLAAFGPQLAEFGLFLDYKHPTGEQISELFQAFEIHIRHIRRLSYRSMHRTRKPYLDTLPHIFPSLEELHVGPGTYSYALLNNIPSNICRLRLDHDYSMPQFPFKAVRNLISRAGRGQLRLESLAIYLRWDDSDITPYTSLGDMCKKRGIDFELKIRSPSVDSEDFY
ncbi:hypothetical protein CERSUDRAFT_121791 [Gelatoporia subvermispora B]|uniref:Amidoligase enzyme n=1 Tax=Ceriporiopsis subvermispora (strain B) TaxID=914234 RepID=M2R4Q9_CERS8|nr:hypothetical protein CERSUDRAFT_121791 [Gelatoporia subvermispora B]